ncbi:MAG: serine/threonine protein kinase [Acidobacteria bacterium]|nr:serine/threonine protein kinase [Acidobacteriota bacterium]
MSPELERLFLEAADLAEPQRGAFLDQHCPDPALRAEVERLLAFDSGSEEYLRAPVAALAGRIGQHVPLDESSQIGAWRIIRPIGRGGMGTVYEAERFDGEVVQRVAIKFVPLSLRTSAILERFRQERQILADLNHPNISRLIDAGTTPDGSPYLVMELIEGVPIDTWCKDKRLSPRQIAALFLPVCSAVQHAHSHLIIHRDLKPANILVTSSGEPKLLDFGIARLLDQAGDRGETTLHAMTPDYASPEQLEGRPMNVATDVFSLGCVLYQLLTGEPPRRDTATARHITLPRASSRRPELRGDLDNILNKCLQPEPERRYPSVERFGEDLRRFLNHEPVSATSDSWSYIALRFFRRNRLPAAAVTALLVSILAGSGGALWQARRAERRFQEVRQLANAFVFQFEQQVRDLPGATRARQFIVHTAIGYLERLAAESGGDPGLQQELAAAYRKISEVQFDPSASSLGDLAGAAASLDQADRLLREVRAATPAGPVTTAEEARLLIRRSEVLEAGGRIEDSLAAAQQSQRLADSLLRDDPSSAGWRELGSQASARAARALRRRGRLDDARRAAERAVSLDRLSLDAGQGGLDTAIRLSSSLRLLARILQAGHDTSAAVDTQREANAVLARMRPLHSDSAALDRSLMIGNSLLGSLLGEAGRSDPEAIGLLQDSYLAARRRVSADPADFRALLDLQAVAVRYAAVLLDSGGTALSLPVLETAMDSARNVLKSDSLNREAKLNYAIALVWSAEYYRLTHQPREDLRVRRQALLLHQDLLLDSPTDPDVLSPYALNLAALAASANEHARLALCREAHDFLTALPHPPQQQEETARALSPLYQACPSGR